MARTFYLGFVCISVPVRSRGTDIPGLPQLLALCERWRVDADSRDLAVLVAREWPLLRNAQAAFARARAGEGPSLIECLTYRHSGHSRADPAKYRPEGELEKWKERDPIKIYRERLRQFGVQQSAIDKIDAEVLDGWERDWLNAYHARVLQEVRKRVPPETAAWLERVCQPI